MMIKSLLPLLFVLTLTFTPVSAALLTVTNTNDSGPGSLRAMVEQANLYIDPDTISFSGAVFAGSTQTITLTSGDLVITAATIIDGPDVSVRISGGGTSRVFSINASMVVLRRVRITDGSSGGDGGGIRIHGGGTSVMLEEVSVNDCVAAGRGGGIYAQDNSVLAITRSTLFNNEAGDNGGGINMQNNTLLRLTNSTLSGNRSKQHGGGLFAINGTFTLLNCTLTNNRADSDGMAPDGDGGGIRAGGGGGTVRLGNCIIAGNHDDTAGVQQKDLSGDFESWGHNLVGISYGIGSGGVPFSLALGDQLGSSVAPLDPQLNALAFTPANSTTRVHTLTGSSPARNAGDNALLASNVWPAIPTTDQRGQNRVIGGTVDIGAVEWPDNAVVGLEVITADASEYGFRTASLRVRRSFSDGNALPVTLTVTNASTAGTGDYDFSGSTFLQLVQPDFQVTIPAAHVATTFNIVPFDDPMEEPVETIVMRPVNAAGYSLDASVSNTRTVYLHDDEFIVTTTAPSGPGSLRAAVDAANASGGGTITIPAGSTVALGGSPLVIDGSLNIVGNNSTVDGGGSSRVFDVIGSGTDGVYLTNLVIRGGITPAEENGAGLRMGGNAIVSLNHCAVLSNNAAKRGGGISVEGGELTLMRSSVHDNTCASGDGGGISVTNGGTLLANDSTIARNATNFSGGGLAIRNSSAFLYSMTIADNVCDYDNNGNGDGGGIFNDTGGAIEIANTVLAGNRDTLTNAGSGTIHPDASGSTAWLVLGGTYVSRNDGVGTVFPAGNPSSPGNFAGTLASPLDPGLELQSGDHLYYSIGFESPLHDSGISMWQMLSIDQIGSSRIRNGVIDIGAVELAAYLVTNANDAGTGSLREAVDLCNAAGHGSIFFDPAFFNVPRTIDISPSGEIEITKPITIEGPTANAKRVTISGGNTSRIFSFNPFWTATGFLTIRNLDFAGGNSVNAAGAKYGGAINETLPTAVILNLSNCTFRNCSSPVKGGALHFDDANITGCIFRQNSAVLDGGAVLSSNSTFTNCVFDENYSQTHGGAILPINCSFTNCLFTGNHSDSSGGAMRAESAVTLNRCVFRGNHSDLVAGLAHGGALYVGYMTHATVSECLFADNDAYAGGAVYMIGQMTAERTTFVRNAASGWGGAVEKNDFESSFTNCTFSANTASHGGGAFNDNAYVSLPTTTFTHCTFTLNRANHDEIGAASGGAINTSNRVALSHTIVSGNIAAGTGGQDPDLDGFFIDNGHNLIGVYVGAQFQHGVNGNLIGSNPALGALRFNGGPTPTHALHVGSAAINAGGSSSITVDQRVVARAAGLPDIGAYEAVEESYTYWAAYTFPAATNSGPSDDYDGDGVANAIEFGTGSDPLSRASRPGIEITRNGNLVSFEFDASAVAPLRFARLSVSSDLQTWLRPDDLLYQFISHDSTNNRTRFRLTLPVGTLGRMFTRLEVD